ncbi:MAG: hypothetical protein FWD59_01895 [Micrococcales bacterium]|nr:hypothetical protein [Micrococcales bacterium]
MTSGFAKNRSDAVRQSIAYLGRRRAYQQDAEIVARLHARGDTLYPDLGPIPPSDLSGLT